MRRRVVVALCALVASVVPAAAARPSPPVFRGPFGKGPDAVWLLAPRKRPRSVVVFLHGWKVAPPSPSYPWVGQFRPWIDHLVDGGSAVLFPAYQSGLDAQGPERVASLHSALKRGFTLLAKPVPPVVVVGYSYGASLAFYYAANARAWNIRIPVAVDAIFPAEPIPGATLPPLPRRIAALIEVGDQDSVAGRAGADAFWSWLARRRGGQRRFVVVHSTPGFAAVHAAPKSTTPAARRSFWRPLDSLIAAARQS